MEKNQDLLICKGSRVDMERRGLCIGVKGRKSQYSDVLCMMSVYRGTDVGLLKESMRSLERQTLREIDLAIYQDGEIEEKVQKFIDLYEPCGSLKRIVIYRSCENRGLASALNTIVLYSFASYEYFARQDCDDRSVPERLDIQKSYMDEYKDVDIVGTAFQGYDIETGELCGIAEYPTEHDDIARLFASSTPIAHATAMMRKSFFVKAGLYSPNHKTLAEDTRLWYSAFYTGCRFANIDRVLYLVGEDDAQFVRRSKTRQIITIFKVRMRYIVHTRAGIGESMKACVELGMRLAIRAMPSKRLVKSLVRLRRR